MYARKKLAKVDIQQRIIGSIDRFLKDLPPLFRKKEEVLAIILFGSFARGEYSPQHSDIDLMILLDRIEEDKALEEAIRKKVATLSTPQQIPIHLLFQYRNVKEEDKSLLLTIAREGKVIFSRKTVVISQNLLGIRPYLLLRFNTTNLPSIKKNKLQRFLYGYKGKEKRYQGLVDGEQVFSAGQGAILVPEEISKKILILAKEIGVPVQQKGRFYR